MHPLGAFCFYKKVDNSGLFIYNIYINKLYFMNTNLFASTFEEASYKERLFFNRLNEIYQLFPKQDWHILQTSYTGSDVYDYLISNDNTYRRYIVEIKIREKTFEEGYIYQTSKHKDLTYIKNIDPDNNRILYINSTPIGTYIWEIDKIIHKYKPIKKEMNKATMTNKEDKIDKSTYILLTEDAKLYPYHWDEKQFLTHIEEINIKNIKREKRINTKKDQQFLVSYNLNKRGKMPT